MEWQSLLTVILLLMLFLGCGVWIGVSLFFTSWLVLAIFTDLPVMRVLGSVIWNNVNSSSLMALPLFIMMGEVLARTKISDDLFGGLTPWVSGLPGGLLHVNVIACAIFAAITGSVNATTATVGKITIPEFRRRGYSETLSIGSLTSSGTLGILIPPSVPMLIYGVTANCSIGRLFIAGLVPGLLLMLFFCGYIMIASKAKGEGGARINSERYGWREKIKSTPKIFPVVVLIGFVLGSIYAGWTTPTEAAAVGLTGALVLAIATRCLTWKLFAECLMSAVRTNCMVMLILIGASFFSVALGFLNLPRWISESIVTLGAGKYTALALMTVVYIILGCLVDGYSMIVMTVPMFLPLAKTYGLDPIWFGIFVILLVQIANITPPIGFNLFLMTGLAERSIGFISRSVMPFILIIVAFAFIMAVFPQVVMFLPDLMAN